MMRTLLIDAINGVGIPTMEMAVAYTKQGTARFTGNQHNPDWAWAQDYLRSADEPTLQALYETLRTTRDEMRDS